MKTLGPFDHANVLAVKVNLQWLYNELDPVALLHELERLQYQFQQQVGRINLAPPADAAIIGTKDAIKDIIRDEFLRLAGTGHAGAVELSAYVCGADEMLRHGTTVLPQFAGRGRLLDVGVIFDL